MLAVAVELRSVLLDRKAVEDDLTHASNPDEQVTVHAKIYRLVALFRNRPICPVGSCDWVY